MCFCAQSYNIAQAIASVCREKVQQKSSCSERNLIGWRTESDRTADGIRSDGERNLIGRRTESDRVAVAVRSLNISYSTTRTALLVYFHQTFTNRNAGVLGIICIFAEAVAEVKASAANNNERYIQHTGCCGDKRPAEEELLGDVDVIYN